MAWVLIAALAVVAAAVLLRAPLRELRARQAHRQQERKRQGRRDREAERVRRSQERAMNPARAAARKGPPRWQQVAQRHGAKCWLCGTRTYADDRSVPGPGSERLGATYPMVDYVLPVDRGGTYEMSNARVAHRHCHALRVADPGREKYGPPRRTYPPSPG